MQREIKSEQLVIDLKPIKYRFFVAPNRNDLEIKQVDLGLVNALTREKIDPTIHYLDQRTFAYFEQINQSFEQFHNQHPYFTRDIQDTNQIKLLAGNYNINKTVIIPKGFSLKIEPGAVLNFAPGASLVSYGPVLAQGTKNKLIRFIGQRVSESWGVFGVLGEHSEKSIFEYCLFENGKNDYINGVFYSSQLSVHYADVVIRNCEFRYAKGDDGLNVKKGRVEIVANYFYENGFDGLDLDWVSGSVENNQFLNNGNDGLDLSGAKNLLISGNVVNKSGDKCLSVGEGSEKTTIIFNNLFFGCDMGVAVKDDSKVVLLNNTIVNNRIGLSIYEKKPVFGGALPKVINTLIWDNEKSIEIDAKSDIDISYSNIKGGYKGDNNFAQEPIFQDNYLLVNNQQNQDLITGGSVKILETIMNIQKQIAPIGMID
ncbi:MAG: right-handed parallel beta-helix repeat-containing protein [bacterium]